MSERLTDEITLRPYNPDKDAKRVAEIVGEIWGGGGDATMEKLFGEIGGKPWAEWTSASVLSYLAGDDAKAFVTQQNGEIIGFCSYVVDKARSLGTVGYNGVAKSHQGLGVGSKMLDYVLAAMRSEGLEYAGVIVMGNEEHLPARRNYESHGFRKILENYYMVQKL